MRSHKRLPSFNPRGHRSILQPNFQIAMLSSSGRVQAVGPHSSLGTRRMRTVYELLDFVALCLGLSLAFLTTLFGVCLLVLRSMLPSGGAVDSSLIEVAGDSTPTASSRFEWFLFEQQQAAVKPTAGTQKERRTNPASTWRTDNSLRDNLATIDAESRRQQADFRQRYQALTSQMDAERQRRMAARGIGGDGSRLSNGKGLFDTPGVRSSRGGSSVRAGIAAGNGQQRPTSRRRYEELTVRIDSSRRRHSQDRGAGGRVTVGRGFRISDTAGVRQFEHRRAGVAGQSRRRLGYRNR